ncbi:MAG: hypothetical protein AAF732_08035, partial [Pseudomonadota bacterium]
ARALAILRGHPQAGTAMSNQQQARASRLAPQAANAARRVAPPAPQLGCSRVGHLKCRDGEHAISMGPGR